jgi:signal transduction histidine kinase
MIFFAGLGFGLFLYSSNRESKINQSWFIVSIFVALWGLALYGVTSTLNSTIALDWQYLLDISAMMIPVTYFAFVCNLLNLKQNLLRRIILYTGACLAVFTVTTLFKTGVDIRYGFYWITPGQYYFIFPFFFAAVTIISLAFLIYGFFVNRDELFRAQIRNTLIAGIIGFGGGITNFFPQVINVYPFGNYFVLLYVFFMSYGVLKYKLLSKKILSAQLFTGAMVLIFLFNLLSIDSLVNWLINFILFILVLVFSILLVRGMYKEVEQREKIENLAKDLAQANSSLEKANSRLKELDELKSEFLSLATHQIRAPLTAIKGYASLILEGDYGEPAPRIREAVQTIFKSCQNLVVIVGEFLDISRIEQGRMKYDITDFDLKKLIVDITVELKPILEQANLSMDFVCQDPCDFTVHADSGKTKQIVGNIIDNAIKYSPSGSIHVTLSESGTSVTVEVKDTGIGIAKEDISKLFGKFVRAKDANKTNVIGTGLGLYVAKQMAEAQGGKIWVESEGLGKGSSFFVMLPKGNSVQTHAGTPMGAGVPQTAIANQGK